MISTSIPGTMLWIGVTSAPDRPARNELSDEHAGVERADIGAERAQHLAVERCGPHHAPGGVRVSISQTRDGDRRPGQHDEQVVDRQLVPNSSKPPASTGGRDTESCCVPQRNLAASPRISTSA